jgi:hypothetical protein
MWYGANKKVSVSQAMTRMMDYHLQQQATNHHRYTTRKVPSDDWVTDTRYNLHDHPFGYQVCTHQKPNQAHDMPNYPPH